MKTRFAVAAAAFALVGAAALPAAAQGQSVTTEQQQLLDEVQRVTEKFKDVSVALEAGYVPDPHGLCVDAAMVGAPAELGAMGIHYLHPALLRLDPPEPGRKVSGSAGSYDPMKPEVLVYEPQADRSMKLVAVEYLVFRDAWYAGGNEEMPTFAGYPFEYMEDDPSTETDEAHGFEPHYELHVWLYRNNPNGLFAEFNPNVTCPRAAAPGH